jgi:hypothetical protein
MHDAAVEVEGEVQTILGQRRKMLELAQVGGADGCEDAGSRFLSGSAMPDMLESICRDHRTA